MKKILLVCSAGMSTSLLVNKMRDAAKECGEEVEINALAIAECSSVINDVDIVLLGPQVRFQKPQVEKLSNGTIPVELIDMRQYGIMDGKGILESTLDKIVSIFRNSKEKKLIFTTRTYIYNNAKDLFYKFPESVQDAFLYVLPHTAELRKE